MHEPMSRSFSSSPFVKTTSDHQQQQQHPPIIRRTIGYALLFALLHSTTLRLIQLKLKFQYQHLDRLMQEMLASKVPALLNALVSSGGGVLFHNI